MIRFIDVTLRRGPERLIESLDVQISPGWRVGVTGRNGCGKSSLFAALRGELGVDTGTLERPPQWVIAHLPQEVAPSERSSLDFVIDGDAELRALEADLDHAMKRDDGLQAAKITERIDAIDGWTAEARAGRLLAGLGFSAADQARAVREFSGGWRMRLGLAQTLMTRADLVLLDEPTNHLDFEAVQWLEDYLCQQPATLLVIAHDRHFLDRVCTHTLHIEHRRGLFQRGGYSDAERARAERLAQDEAASIRLTEERAHLEDFVRRFRAKATKARQAQSRLKRLSKLDDIVLLRAARPKPIPLHNPKRLPDPLLEIENAHVPGTDPDTPRLVGATLRLRPDDRIGILGPNGAGKSTLLGVLAGVTGLSNGLRQVAADIEIGYFAQHQREQLDETDTPLAHLKRLDPRVPEQAIRDRLGRFGFSGQQMDGSIQGLSGGERVRLVLATIFSKRPSVLLLDEPTNHLDLEMREVLADALERFTGAVVVVAHDRALLERACDRFWRVDRGCVAEYPGDLDDYLNEVTSGPAAASEASLRQADTGPLEWLGAKPIAPRSGAISAQDTDHAHSASPSTDACHTSPNPRPPAPHASKTPAADNTGPRASSNQKFAPGNRNGAAPTDTRTTKAGGNLHEARKAAARAEAQAERMLEKIELELAAIDERLADPALYTQPNGASDAEQLTQQREQLCRQRDDAETRLLDTMAEREALDAQAKRA